MTCRKPNTISGRQSLVEPSSVAQLRREAGKARSLADAAFNDEARRQLHEIATSLDREASLMEAALSAKHGGTPRQVMATTQVARP